LKLFFNSLRRKYLILNLPHAQESCAMAAVLLESLFELIIAILVFVSIPVLGLFPLLRPALSALF
jgi:hypothetical protein